MNRQDIGQSEGQQNKYSSYITSLNNWMNGKLLCISTLLTLKKHWTQFTEKVYESSVKAILKQFYEEFNCAVIDGREWSDLVEIKTQGVKQGCKMSGFLFLVALKAEKREEDPKQHGEEQSRRRKGKLMEILGWGKGCICWQRWMEMVFWCLMCHNTHRKYDPKAKRGFGLDNDFTHSSAMTLIFDHETLFIVTAHLLLNCTLWVKYKPDCQIGRENMPKTCYVRYVIVSLKKIFRLLYWHIFSLLE